MELTLENIFNKKNKSIDTYEFISDSNNFVRQYTIDVDLEDIAQETKVLDVVFFDNDRNSSVILANIKKGEQAVNLNGITVSVNIRDLEQETVVTYPAVVSNAVAGLVEFKMPNNIIDYNGVVEFEFSLQKEQKIITSRIYSCIINNSLGFQKVSPDDEEVGLLQELINRTQQASDRVEQIKQEYTTLLGDMQSSKETFDTNVQTSNTLVSQITQQKNQIDTKLQDATTKVNQIDTNLTSATNKVGQIDTKLQSATNLEQQINQVKTQVDSKLQEATSKVNQIDTNLSSSTTSKQQIDTLLTQSQQAKTNIDNLYSQAQNLVSQMTTSKNEFDNNVAESERVLLQLQQELQNIINGLQITITPQDIDDIIGLIQ